MTSKQVDRDKNIKLIVLIGMIIHITISLHYYAAIILQKETPTDDVNTQTLLSSVVITIALTVALSTNIHIFHF